MGLPCQLPSRHACHLFSNPRGDVFFFCYLKCSELFHYLIILLGVFSSPFPHIQGNYKEEFLEGSLKMWAKSFERRISWISWNTISQTISQSTLSYTIFFTLWDNILAKFFMQHLDKWVRYKGALIFPLPTQKRRV